MPLPGHAEPLIAHAQPDGPEPRRDPLMRRALRRRRRGPRPLPSQRHGEPVRLVPRRRRARATAQHRIGTNTSQACHKHALFRCTPRRATHRAACPARVELVNQESTKSTLACAQLRRAPVERRSTSHDLRACGLIATTRSSTRVRNGRLLPALSRCLRRRPPEHLRSRACFLAAVKACGPDAVLSPLLRRRASGASSSGTTATPRSPRRTPRKHPRHPHPHERQHIERTFHKGIPVTTPARTLIDLSSMLPFKPAAQSGQRSPQPAPHHARTNSSPPTTEAPSKLRAILATAAPTRNEFEDVVLALLEDLPKPDVNQPPRLRLRPRLPLARPPPHPRSRQHAVPRPHSSPAPTTPPARPTSKPHGERVLRVTWRQATTQPHKTRARIEAALERGTLTYRT